jgi:hypothetical protein
MARAQGPLQLDRPVIEVVLTRAQGGQKVTRTLLADTGAGNLQATFELVLDENDCLLCGRPVSQSIPLGGAYTGSYPLYLIRVEIPLLTFTRRVLVVGVPDPPRDLQGIACFRFLNRFTYGNFGNPGEFALET